MSTPGTWCHSFSSLANSLLCSMLRLHFNNKQDNWYELILQLDSRFLLSLGDILTWGRFLPLPLPGSIALPWPLTSANLENFKSCLHFHFKGGDQLLLYRFCPKFCFRLHIQLDGGQGDRTCMGGSYVIRNIVCIRVIRRWGRWLVSGPMLLS